MHDPEPVLISIQVGTPRTIASNAEGATDASDRRWTTGIFKSPVEGPLFLGATNLAGDGQADPENHGGPDKAVCAYSADHYGDWRADPELAAMAPGAFGENFTIRGLTETTVCVGDIWSVGDALIQVSQPRQPCWKLARKWGVKDLTARVVRTGRTGWYFRVLREGTVSAGARLTLLDRQYPAWTIQAANDVMHGRPVDVDASAALGTIPALSRAWRGTLTSRARGEYLTR